MPTVSCARCGQTREGLPRPPFPGPEGARLQQRVCRSCWQEWLLMQTKVINEYRLNLGDPAHAELLDRQMSVFLGLAEPETSALPEAPYGFGEGGPEGKG